MSAGTSFLVSSKLDQHDRVRLGRRDLVDLCGVVRRVGRVELLGDDVAAAGLDALVDLRRKKLTVGVLAGQDRHVVLPVLDEGVGHHGALEDVGRRGAEVQVLRVRLRVVKRRRGVRGRELDDTGTGDLVDHAQRHRRGGGTDDGVRVGVEQLVGLGASDVGRAVTGVRLDLYDVLVQHAAGRVDVVDGGLYAGELGRAEEGKVSRLREQGADGQGAVSLGGLRATVGLATGVGVGITAACSEHQGCGGENCGRAPSASRANH